GGGSEGAVGADGCWGGARAVLQTLKQRVAANALELARQGVPKAPFYLTGQVGGRPFSLHAEGERVFLTGAEGRTEVDLVPPGGPEQALPQPVCPQGRPGGPWAEPDPAGPPAPGVSPLDELAEGGLIDLAEPPAEEGA